MYLGDYRAVAKTVFGQKIFVDTRDVSIAPHLLLDGMWEEWITSAIGPLMRGSLFVDVGANFGWYSLLAAKSNARKIVSVEPNDRLFSLLSQTMSVNGIKSKLLSNIVSDYYKENVPQLLAYDFSNLGGGSVSTGASSMSTLERGKETHQLVSVRTLDEILSEVYSEEPQLNSALLLLKIDVEGFEPRVVLGGKSAIEQHRTVAFVEYHADPNRSGKLLDMLEFFEQTGFTMSHVLKNAEFATITREGLGALPDAEMLCFRKFAD